MKWAYGVTTVPSRRDTLLPQTLQSLREAGFGEPRLFADNCDAIQSNWYRSTFNLEVTNRWPVIRTYGNWMLSLWELYIRDPSADRYAIFQDDFVTYKNLRRYLNKCPYPDKGYWNLYTFPSNQEICPRDKHGRYHVGWYESNQFGRGAVALIFSREAITTLLTHEHMVNRVQDCARGHRSVDGGVVTCLVQKEGWKEYVHNPSLTQHTGLVSSMGSNPQRLALSFKGEEFDAMELLGNVGTPSESNS